MCLIIPVICLCGQSKALLLFLPACKGTQWMSQCLISPVSRGSRAPSLTAHSPLGRAACCCGPPGASPPGHTGSPPPAPRVRPQCSAYTCKHRVTPRQLPKSPYPFILILIMIIAIFFVNLVLIYFQYIQDYHPAFPAFAVRTENCIKLTMCLTKQYYHQCCTNSTFSQST